jgi:hypothetical protein
VSHRLSTKSNNIEHGAGVSIRLRTSIIVDPASVSADIYPLCGVGTYSADGTGSPPCLACPPGRYGSTLGLNSSACTGPCSALPRSNREILPAGHSVFVCSEGAVSAKGVPSVTYPNQGFVKHFVTLDARVISNGTYGNVAVAQMDSDPYVDLVHGQFWYKSDGLSPPSFSARMYCQTGPNGNMTFPAGLKVQTVDRKQHYASTERTRCIMHNFAGWSATLW